MPLLYVVIILLIFCGHFLICEGRRYTDKIQDECYDKLYLEVNGKHEFFVHVTSAMSTPAVYLTMFRNGAGYKEGEPVDYDIKAEQDKTTFVITYHNHLKLNLTDNGTLFQFEASYDDDETIVLKNFTLYLYENKKDFPSKSPDYVQVDMQGDNECINNENEIEKTATPKAVIIAFVIGIFVALAIIVFVAITAYYKIVPRKMSKYKVSEDVIQNFFNGGYRAEDFQSGSREAIMLVERMFSNFTTGPYNVEYEIPKKQLKIGKEVLGGGCFGTVVKGSLCQNNIPRDVACKSIKLSLCVITNESKRKELEKSFASFLREIKILQNIGHHPNVVKYIGSVTNKIKHFEAYLVMELCLKEDLGNYLKQYKPQFFSRQSSDYSALTILEGYDNSEASSSPTNTFNNEYMCTTYTKQDLLRWTIDISSGMEFLSNKLFVHCDLAARNVLLSHDNECGRLVAKINDFGLSKHLERNTGEDSEVYYRLNETAVIPCLWMAPEVVSARKVSVSSDIWSFGVTMWEIFSLGKTPFLDDKKSKDVDTIACLLQEGVRLCQPDYATSKIYEIMEYCWQDAPEDRPRFVELKKLLSSEYDEQFPN